MMRIFSTVFAGLLGLAFGSFLNVCLSRWPRGESVALPRSHCRHCGRTLAWWENIPLASWLALRGRCRSCHAWIGWRYPLVELAVGGLWALSAWQCMDGLASLAPALAGYNLATLAGLLLLLWLLTALAGLDAEQLWLPDWLTLPGTAAGFAFAVLKLAFLVKLSALSGLSSTSGLENSWLTFWGAAFARLLGILAAAGLVLLIRWIYKLIRHREGIGLGDAKLMALLAAWLGLPGALLAFVLGVVLGAAVAVVMLLFPSARKDSWAASRLPLGTFLCIGGMVSALWGEPLIALYQRWSGF